MEITMLNKRRKMGTLFVVLLAALGGCAGDEADERTLAEAEADQNLAEGTQALLGCVGSTCDNKSPDLCEADAYTVASSDIWTSGGVATGKVAIRYSPSCKAAWTRVSTTSGVAFLRAEFTRTTQGATATSQAASPSATNALRSLMLGVSSGARFTAIGRIGPSYGYYPYAGNVSTTF
jgi:hypothetical protein